MHLHFLFNYHLLIYKNNVNYKSKYKSINYINLLKPLYNYFINK